MPQNPRSPRHRRALGLFVALLATSTAHAQAPSLQDVAGLAGPKPGTTTVYVAKAIITMDPEQPRAEALAVKDGRFVAVGKLADVQAVAGKDSRLDRTFANQVVIAGFVEQHVHPVLAALTMNTKVISIEDWDTIDGFSPNAAYFPNILETRPFWNEICARSLTLINPLPFCQDFLHGFGSDAAY